MEDNEEIIETDVQLTEEEENLFDESWDEDSTLDAEGYAGETEPEPDEPEEPEDAQPEAEPDNDSDNSEEQTPEAEEKTEEGHQLFKINYLGKEEELTLDQMTELAQKGRDYDHVRQERDQLKTANSGNDRKMAFLEDLAKRSGLSVDEQIDKTRALWLQVDEADKGNEISEEEALERVKKTKTEAKATAQDTNESGGGKALSDENINRFLAVYPNVKAEEIPQEVWDNCIKLNGDLLSAYLVYENKQLKAGKTKTEEAEQKKAQNQKNENRSTGSRRTAGSGKLTDSFDEGWDS